MAVLETRGKSSDPSPFRWVISRRYCRDLQQAIHVTIKCILGWLPFTLSLHLKIHDHFIDRWIHIHTRRKSIGLFHEAPTTLPSSPIVSPSPARSYTSLHQRVSFIQCDAWHVGPPADGAYKPPYRLAVLPRTERRVLKHLLNTPKHFVLSVERHTLHAAHFDIVIFIDETLLCLGPGIPLLPCRDAPFRASGALAS